MSLKNKIPNIDLESVPCPNGSQPYDKELFTGHDRLHDLPGEYSVVQCQSCGLIRTNPRPTPETISFYYPDDYGPYVNTRIQSEGNVSSVKRVLRRLSHFIIRLNTSVIPPIKPGRLLEIGCASGSYLAQMDAKGWQVEGIEFSETAANRARSAGFNVQIGSLENASEPTEHYDLIVGWMVVEHLHDPVGALSKLSSWACTGGWLVISVPNIASFDFRFFKKAGYALQLPAHLYHYTPKTLNTILAKSGWKMEQVYHQRVLGNLMGSIGYLLEDYGAPKWLVRPFKRYPGNSRRLGLILYPLAWILSLFGQTGRMTVWARKIQKK
ncbi:MAG: class I SAM-dependent methyltransferase [Pseudomonadota bacterium]